MGQLCCRPRYSRCCSGAITGTSAACSPYKDGRTKSAVIVDNNLSIPGNGWVAQSPAWQVTLMLTRSYGTSFVFQLQAEKPEGTHDTQSHGKQRVCSVVRTLESIKVVSSVERIPPDEAASAEESKGALPGQTQVLWSTVEVLPKTVSRKNSSPSVKQ